MLRHAMPMDAKKLWSMAKDTGNEWLDDDASRLAAALAFYTLLSIAPLLVLLVAVAGLILGDAAARGEVAGQLNAFMGSQASEGIQALLSTAQSPTEGVMATIISMVVLFFGASGVFGELQASLNTVWGVTAKPGRGVMGVVKDRFFSFAMVLGVAFLLLVSLVVSTVLSAIGHRLSPSVPGLAFLWHIVNFVVSFASVTVLFALTFKIVPDVRIAWKHVWVGAIATALLFTIGKSLLALYLGRASVSSVYGAAGSVVVLVIWVYYSAQILLLGAEFTQVYAKATGARIEPSANAIRQRRVRGEVDVSA
jgi:membrane protein